MAVGSVQTNVFERSHWWRDARPLAGSFDSTRAVMQSGVICARWRFFFCVGSEQVMILPVQRVLWRRARCFFFCCGCLMICCSWGGELWTVKFKIDRAMCVSWSILELRLRLLGWLMCFFNVLWALCGNLQRWCDYRFMTMLDCGECWTCICIAWNCTVLNRISDREAMFQFMYNEIVCYKNVDK